MQKASVRIESMTIPTYPEPEKEPMPLFSEHRVHQRSSGRPYPNKAVLEVNRQVREDRTYTVVHLENEYLDVLVLPQIGGRIFAARDKVSGYLDSRISYPIAGDATFNGIDMHVPRDISWHKNTRDATSYFACASKYDFFGGYDHGRGCGVVHIGDHHISPGKKMFTWAYNQLARTWERALTDTDGQYAELMAGSYTDNQPDFAWLEPYETKVFSQYWYPIRRIGTPSYANLNCALSLQRDCLWIQPTKSFGEAQVEVTAGGRRILSRTIALNAAEPVQLDWQRPEALVTVRITAGGRLLASYAEEKPDPLKKPPVKDPLPLAAEMRSADELYLAGVHVEQYRDPAAMPDAYWLEALKRDPDHVNSLLGMAKYCYQMGRLTEAEAYARHALKCLTKFNMHLQSGDPCFLLGQILEAQGGLQEAYDLYRKAAWNGSAVSKAMARASCIDLKNGDPEAAVAHARQAMERDAKHPLAPAVLVLGYRALGETAMAEAVVREVMQQDRLNHLIRWLGGVKEAEFFAGLHSSPSQTVLDMAFDLESMGGDALAIQLLEQLGAHCGHTVMTLYVLAYLQDKLGIDCRETLALADHADVGDAYPVRLGEMRVLEAMRQKGAVRASFLLGCLLYNKRQYARVAELFEESIRLQPDHYMAYRSLAIACFSHLNRREEAPALMEKARALNCTQQILYESAVLMDLMGADPAEKIALLAPRAATFRRDDLFVELAKAYNQSGQPEKALEVLLSHAFVACEGGEHAIADQYMYAHFQLGMRKIHDGNLAEGYHALEKALTLPESLGSGIWNRCKYVPHRFYMAQCLLGMGREEEANAIFREILQIEVDFFSDMHLRELPYYQALSAEALGMQQRAWNIMGRAKRDWLANLDRKDSGFFSTTPFFISFVPDPASARRGCCLYLLGLVERYQGNRERAKSLFEESLRLNPDNLFCRYYASL